MPPLTSSQAERGPSASRANWTGAVITTTSNPQRLLARNLQRISWKTFNVAVVSGMLGYTDDPACAYIPMTNPDGTPLLGYVADAPVETNEIWFHGPVGSVIGVSEA